MVFGSIAFSILRAAKAHNGFQHRLIAHYTPSRIYSQTFASRDSTRLALRRPFGFHSFHEVGNSGKGEGDVAASEANEGVLKNILFPCHQRGGLNLTDLKAEIAKILGSYDLEQDCLFYSYENQCNGFLATLTEDQVELIKKSLDVMSVMREGVELHRM